MSPAEQYEQLRQPRRVRERALFPATREPSELELQARWFAGDFGKTFRSVCGKDVEIVQFGTWNRESGPDFTDSVIRVNGGDAIRGSVEFDLVNRSWETHGHSTNSAFENTVLHVFVQAAEQAFFSRTPSHRNVLQVRVDLAALPDNFSTSVPLAHAGRCQAPLRDLPEERVLGVLAGASRFRLQRKAARFRTLTESHGRDEALFQELAAALGYKRNKLPFTLLAQRLSLGTLRSRSEEAEALLFGVAGFLSAADLSVYQDDTRKYVRRLWDQWWPRRDEMERLNLPASLWRHTGARPLNHPQRRLAALAAIARGWSALIQSLADHTGGAVRKFLVSLSHPFWDHHYTLTSEIAPKEMALVGESRAAEIMANVVFPLFWSEGRDVWSDYAKLGARLSNRRVETAVARLFGDDARRSMFVKTVAQQQGLLQIYEDFCLQDNSDCAHCPFPEQMQKWT